MRKISPESLWRWVGTVELAVLPSRQETAEQNRLSPLKLSDSLASSKPGSLQSSTSQRDKGEKALKALPVHRLSEKSRLLVPCRVPQLMPRNLQVPWSADPDQIKA